MQSKADNYSDIIMSDIKPFVISTISFDTSFN